MDSGKDEQRTGDAAPIGMLFDPMEQMRELLFGAAKRETESQLAALDRTIEDMRREFLARFEALESRLVEIAQESEKNRSESVSAIGGAIADLGAAIQNMSANRKA